MKRRDFIKHLPIGIAATSIPIAFPGFTGTAFGRNAMMDALLNGSQDTDRVLVLINLSGGNDGLNTCIPFYNQRYHDQRPKLKFGQAELQGFQIRPGEMAFNPMFQHTYSTNANRKSTLLDMWKDGKFAIVQNVGYTDGSRSHFRSTDIWNTGSDSNLIVSTGWVGRYLETVKPDYPFPGPNGVEPTDDPLAMAIGYTPPLTFQGSKSVMGIAVNDPSAYNAAFLYDDDDPPANNYGDELQYVRNILVQSDIYGERFKTVHFPNGQTPPNNVTYPTPASNQLATQLKKVAWCIAKGMKTRVYFVQQGGYDTHVQQTKLDDAGHGALLFQLAEAISLFQKDLEGFGVADRVIGMTYSEFGRRVNENNNEGTDHGAAAPQFFFGNAINGELYGKHPNLTPYKDDPVNGLDVYSDIRQEFDFRQLFAGVLTDWFGVDDIVRKAILNKPDFTSKTDFGFQFPVNGSTKTQSLIRPEFLASVPHTQEVDRIFVLDQNFPNPVQNQTTIPFRLSESATVRLEIFDSRGELVATPVEALLGRGEHPVTFDARRLGNGKYFYRLDVNGVVETKSMMVVK